VKGGFSSFQDLFNVVIDKMYPAHEGSPIPRTCSVRVWNVFCPCARAGRASSEIKESIEGAVSASSALGGDSQESKPKKILMIKPSDGRPCEGTDRNGEQCGFASEEVLSDPDSDEPAYFCKTHMNSVLAGYDPRNFEVRRGNLSQEGNQP